MGLTSALVHQARTVSRSPVSGGTKVAGETPYTTVNGTQFACRISSPSSNEIRQDQTHFTEYVRDVTCLVGMVDTAGVTLAPKADMQIEVMGSPYAGMYKVMGKPTPIIKKVDQIGWIIALKEFSGKDAG